VDKNNFHKIVGQGKWVLLDFYTKNCQYCFELMPHYNQLVDYFSDPKSKNYRSDIVIGKINGDENAKISEMYGVD
jgi:thiol-disulfide isomerase/thioredoxin